MQKMQFWLIFIVFLTNSLLFANETVENKLKKISYLERASLSFFFKEFFLKDALGHVIFFETKPVATTGIFKEKNRRLFKHCLANLIETAHDKYFEKGWDVWKKYEQLFPHPDFIFAEDETITDDGETILNFYVVNKKNLNECLVLHLETFKELLGNNFSVDEFMKRLENEKQLLPLINSDEALLGIILGYGLESSIEFKNEELRTNYSGISISTPENCSIWPLGFMGNPESTNVQHLVKIYEKETAELHNKYSSSSSLLTMILKRLISENPG